MEIGPGCQFETQTSRQGKIPPVDQITYGELSWAGLECENDMEILTKAFTLRFKLSPQSHLKKEFEINNFEQLSMSTSTMIPASHCLRPVTILDAS